LTVNDRHLFSLVKMHDLSQLPPDVETQVSAEDRVSLKYVLNSHFTNKDSISDSSSLTRVFLYTTDSEVESIID